MQRRICSFYFLHFIIFSYTFFLSSFLKTSSYLYSPNYSIFNISSNLFQNNPSSFSIWTKEFLFPNKSSFFSDYSYFITTSKVGIISIIYKNKTLFSIDFKKKMCKTNFNQANIIKGDNVILPMEGKLFRVKTNLETENFEEFTTPIKELVDMTPFSLWFSQDYYFTSDKKYFIVKLTKNEKSKVNIDINLDYIIFVDYTLICLKDGIQVWNTTVTNFIFLDKNENNKIKNTNIHIEDNILIYENNDIMEINMKDIFGNKYNDLLFIHGYNKKNKKYVKLYDFNTYIHIIQNNSADNNIEENNNNEFQNKDNNRINIYSSYKFEIDLKIYYYFVFFILLFLILLISNNSIYKTFFSLKDFFSKKYQSKFIDKTLISKDKAQNIDEKKEAFNKEVSEKESFKLIRDYFENNLIHLGDLDLKPSKSKEKKHKDSLINDVRFLIQKDFKNIKKNKNSISTGDLNSLLKENNDLISPSKTIISRNPKILKELEISKNNQINDNDNQTRLEKDFKEITLLKKNINKDSFVVILKAKHKIDEQLYTIKIKKLSNPVEEQSVIEEAKNMEKIRSKYIVEYITCWVDTSLGHFEYLFNNKSKKHEDINNDDFFSSKKQSKISDKNLKYLISHEITDDYYIKQLYTKDYLSEDECPTNTKAKINLDNKYYQKKEESKNNKNNKKKKKNGYIDDYSIEKKKSENQKDVSDLNVYFFIQMEFCQQITLDKYIKAHISSKINNKVMYTFTYQLIKGLAKIHEKEIIHANINPKNIFVINENLIKIGNFSFAKEIKIKEKQKSNKFNKMPKSQSSQNIMELIENDDYEDSNIGESLYLSPEQEIGLRLSKKSDIYSLGLVLYEMCECFSEQKIREISINRLKKYKIFRKKFKNDYFFQYNLIIQMLESDEEKRPSCEELLDSKYMQSWKSTI